MKNLYNGFFSLILIIVFSTLYQPAYSQQQYTDYIGVKIINNNHLLERNEDRRFLYTVNDYINRASQKRACDPRSIAKKPFPLKGVTAKRCLKTKQPAPTNSQFDTKWDAYNHRYQEGFLKGADRNKRNVRLGLFREESGGWAEKQGYTCKWIIDGKRILGSHPCRKWEARLSTGKHTARVKVFRNDREVYQTGDLKFEIRDVLIVAMGDLFGSGKAIPIPISCSTRIRRWVGSINSAPPDGSIGQRCHRSLFASSSLATLLLADEIGVFLLHREHRVFGCGNDLRADEKICGKADSQAGSSPMDFDDRKWPPLKSRL